MSNLKLSIGGRSFAVSCAPGEEEHIRALGERIDESIRKAGAMGQSEPRMLLFAALMLADELHEMQRAAAPAPRSAPPERDPEADAQLSRTIDAITQRIENIARHLEGGDHHP
ncbi:cell division protein ZapA [Croceicoccus hydrothermalis]|uniref:cell division protein ZapA n=1 Tax=Croceicoccus hydrothermalis TaxID=2867964 RepID=UPI001EFBDA85|nr:cell division protein ZapA [Croceicoccus hydrothermalis]